MYKLTPETKFVYQKS